MMIEQAISDDELQSYFDYLVKNHDILTMQDFNLIDTEEAQQYSVEELALEVV